MMNIRVIIILNIIFWICVIPSVHSFIRIWGNIMSMIDNLQYTLPLLTAIMKLVLLWQKKKGILKLERRNVRRKAKLIIRSHFLDFVIKSLNKKTNSVILNSRNIKQN